jgi:hypothetical protein
MDGAIRAIKVLEITFFDLFLCVRVWWVCDKIGTRAIIFFEVKCNINTGLSFGQRQE